MKRITLLIIVALCMLSVQAGVITHSETFDTSGWNTRVETIDTTQYIRITYDGIDLVSEPGKPQLPVKYVRLLVPYNATNISVNCSYGSCSSQTLAAKVIPVEVPRIANETASDSPILCEDSTVYNTNAAYPAGLSKIVSDGYFMGDNHVITIALYPMQYNPVTGQATNYSSLTLSVSYDAGSEPANLLHRNNERACAKDLAMLAEVVENPQQIQSFKAPARPVSTHGNNAINPLVESYDYTIITTRELKPAFNRLIAMKKQKGYSAGAVCIEDIMQNPNVNGGDSICDANKNVISVITDSAGVIRQYLKRAFENGTRYVLMGGRKVPYRYGYRKYTIKYVPHFVHIPTDWYYSDLRTNWNDTLKGSYVSPLNLQLENYDASLYVGRLIADSSADIENYCKKLFQYELNPGNGDMSYLNRALIVEGADTFDLEHKAAKKYREIGMLTTEINQSGLDYPSGKMVVDTLKYHGIISLHGHGSPHTTTVNHCYQLHHSFTNRVICALDTCENTTDHPKIIEVGNGLECMDNKYYPSIFYSWSCTTTPFDIYTGSTKTYYGWNIGQSYTLAKDYGGVAYLGCTREGFTSYYNREVDFIDALVTNLNIGIAEAKTKQKYHDSFFAMTHNLIGDPEFQVWTQSPSNNNDVVITRTDNIIRITGISGENATVAYCNDSIQGFTEAINGEALITSVNPNSSIVVCAKNHLVFIAPLILQNYIINKSQYVLATKVTAGSNVDSNRSNGDVVVKTGVNYEIQCGGKVEFNGGFTVERGASLTVYKPQPLTL